MTTESKRESKIISMYMYLVILATNHASIVKIFINIGNILNNTIIRYQIINNHREL